MKNIKILFENPRIFEPSSIALTKGLVGLYFIFTSGLQIQYPFNRSRLIYIGMSERKTNSIGSRLSGHFDGSSKNQGLINYRSVDQLNFTVLNFEMFRNLWKLRIEQLESYFILDFVRKFGVYPICNNKSGFDFVGQELELSLNIGWNYFD